MKKCHKNNFMYHNDDLLRCLPMFIPICPRVKWWTGSRFVYVSSYVTTFDLRCAYCIWRD